MISGGVSSDSLLQHGRLLADGNHWFILMLEPFQINSTTELEFSFQDVDNKGIKKGMKWDYIELRKMNSSF
jgi:hypothetical protein